MTNILVVEDDKEINALLCNILRQNGYYAMSVLSGTQALFTFQKDQFDMVLLDLMLPDLSGEDFLKEIRKTSHVPVIVISAKGETTVKVEMLRIGADDYITKPFDNDEVLARIESNLRRYHVWRDGTETLTFGNIQMDLISKTVKVNQKNIVFTSKEFQILKMLMENPRQVFSKESLFESIWKEPYAYDDNTINTHISNIRRKLKMAAPNHDYIETVWGMGYKLNEKLSIREKSSLNFRFS